MYNSKVKVRTLNKGIRKTECIILVSGVLENEALA
jgi:hypothetical protein